MSKFFHLQTKYENTTAYIVEKTYSQPNNLCLEIHDARSGEPLFVATTNIAGYVCHPGHVLIKDWSENAGIYDALLKAGVIGPVVHRIQSGFVEAYECEYLKGK